MWVTRLSLPSPYVELVNILLSCGEEVKEALTRSVRLQCEQNWGALCDSLSLCSSLESPPASTAVGQHRHHLPSHLEPEHPRPPRQDKEKVGKAGFGTHPRNRNQGSRRHNLEAGLMAEQEDSKATDIRRWKLRRNHEARATFESHTCRLVHTSHTHIHTHISQCRQTEQEETSANLSSPSSASPVIPAAPHGKLAG